MQPSDRTYEQDQESTAPELPFFRMTRRRLWAGGLLLVLFLLGFLPPYINVSRYKQRIATNIGASLGRPVHFRNLALSLLPLPGFTLENFVVEEDPAFGSEPVLRADTVRATVRLSSLWGPRVEFSKISLTDASVNLVHNAGGQWNLQSVLLRASRIQAAPTGQLRAGPAPRFPYIEATGARINLKLDQEKTPYSLNDSDFALWLPEPNQWHFRLEAHPTRTDTAPADAGILHVDGTLGNSNAHAATLADVPIDLHVDWQDAQLVGLSHLVLGRDAGLRGDLNLDVIVEGTVGHAEIASHLQLAHGRRAEFVPPHELSVEATCKASAQDTFHAFSAIECHWPPADSPNHSVLILSAAVPDTRQPALSSASLTLPALPAATFLDWIRVATSHPPTGLFGPGTLAGTLTRAPSDSTSSTLQSRPHQQLAAPSPAWSGEVELSGESLQTEGLGPDPIPLGDVLLRSTEPPLSGGVVPQTIPSGFDLLPIDLPLGGKQPVTLDGHFDATGYTLHLTGSAIPSRLFALADAIPQFGDGLRLLLDPPSPEPHASEEAGPRPASPRSMRARNGNAAAPSAPDPPPTPVAYDLTATRIWGSPQVWRETETLPPAAHHHAAR